jgi:nucleotide-binding universal stress UspA family protein
MYRRILVPLEREGGAEAHLHSVAALAYEIGAELILLRMVTVIPDDEYVIRHIQVEAGSSGAKRKEEAEEYVGRLRSGLQDQGVSVKTAVVVSDKAEDEAILEYATQAQCDLIVLPNQRRSLVSRWLQGNVPAKVQRRSQLPVLLIREAG